MKRSIVLILIGLLFMSFKVPDRVEAALKLSGSNRPELEKVIRHYVKDSLKLRAAYFLIANMPGHVGMKREPGEQFVEEKPDLKYITAAQLIENIDYAFLAWRFPWARHLSFADFCEYILPYRFHNEPLEAWRKTYMEKFAWLADSMKNETDFLKMFLLMIKHGPREISPSLENSDYIAKTPLKLLDGHFFESCLDETGKIIFKLRALGIPVVHEYILQWGNRSMGHDYAAMMDKQGTFIPMMSPLSETSYLAPKIYRRFFSIKSPEKIDPTGQIRQMFDLPDPFSIDVTTNYIPTSDIRLPLAALGNLPAKGIPLLCVFDNQKWIPVCTGSISGDTLYYRNVGQNIMYLPLSYQDNGVVQPLCSPIAVKGTGKVLQNLTEAASSNSGRLLLYRKYPPPKLLIDGLSGGLVQAANQANFQDSVNIYNIDTLIGTGYQKIKVATDKAYRYWRIKFRQLGIVAEMKFIDMAGSAVQGNVIKRELKDTTEKYLNYASLAFDGKVLSYVYLRRDDWIGMDFETPRRFKEIRVLGPNDDNQIAKDELYELFYWEKGQWKSLGRQTGSDEQVLVYENAPLNALFLLRNLSKGKEERPFTYNNQTQVWW